MERLYAVLALRQLGLPLDAIGEVIDGTLSIETVLTQHRAYLDQQLVAMRTLRAQLLTMVRVAQGVEASSVTDFLDLIRKVITVDDTVKRYFSESQLAELAERRDPTSSEAQALAREWMGLLQQFHGGSPALRDSLYRMQAENADSIEQDHGGPSPAQLEFIRRANAASE